MAYDIGARLGIEGEKAFNDSIDQEMDRLIETEGALSAANGTGADSADVMAAHVEGLVSELENLGVAYDESCPACYICLFYMQN